MSSKTSLKKKEENNLDYTEKLGNARIVPVVVIEDARHSVDTAKALLAGGIDVMEITLRTEAGLDAIRNVEAECPEILVGAGTVLSLEQCRKAVAAGAKFIVSPGFDEQIVKWCVKHRITIMPGCVTPTEIMAALKYGLKVLKFFPAKIYGGIDAMKALSSPFGMVKFVPTGGINTKNLAEVLSAPFVHAVGGSWICTSADIKAGNFDKITALSREAFEMLKRG